MTVDRPLQSLPQSLFTWSYCIGKSKDVPVTHDIEQLQIEDNCSSSSKSPLQEDVSSSTSLPPSDIPQLSISQEISGWDRLRSLYEQPSMERYYSQRVLFKRIPPVTRMGFLTGFFFGGLSTVAQARETFERSNVGRKYLSPSDEFKRKADYAIVRFAKSGFITGFKCALISGSIVIFTTHLAAYRQKFSSWYFPAVSGALALALHEGMEIFSFSLFAKRVFVALVGGIFMFPLGIIGSLKAVALGVTSGLTLSAGVHLIALSVNKSVDEVYWSFKRNYENNLRIDKEWEDRVTALMKSEGIKWRGNAATKLRKLDEEKMAVQDI